MKTENRSAQMQKELLEYCILLYLEKGPVSVSAILDNLKSSNLLVVEGSAFAILAKMKCQGYLIGTWLELPEMPPFKTYELTPHGMGFLNSLKNSWNEMLTAAAHASNAS